MINVLRLLLIAIIFINCKPVQDSPEIDGGGHEGPEMKDPIVFEVIKIRSKPKIETYWSGGMPEFIFCKSSGISSTRAAQGISYWKRLGYPIENVRYGVDGPECRGDPEQGTIVIRIIDNTIPIHQNLSVTKVYYRRDTKEILSSSIYLISAYANRPRLIEHEIGHALGWRHYNRYLHVMNSEYDNTGYDSSGLDYSIYLEQILNIF